MRTHGLAMGIRGLGLSIVMLGAVLLSSCGGGGGGTPPAPAADPTGYYTGSLTLTEASKVSTTYTDVQAIIANNRMMFFSSLSGYSVDSSISVTANSFTGTATTYLDGVMSASGVAITSPTDGISQGKVVKGTIATNNTVSASFNLVYDASNSNLATLARLDTTSTKSFSGYPPKATIGNASAIVFLPGKVADSLYLDYATLSDGTFYICGLTTYNIKLPNTTVIANSAIYNVINSQLLSCGTSTIIANNYTGMASLHTGMTTDDTLIFMLANGSYHFYAVYTR